MQITLFQISDNRAYIDLTIEDAASVTTLQLWDANTYKDSSLAIDLSSKLTGSATENIVITLDDLDIPYFDGVYFIEALTTTESHAAIVGDLTRYKECILTKIVDLAAQSDCLTIDNPALLNAHTLLISLEVALERSYIDEILLIAKVLNRYCSNECKGCGEYTDIIDPTYLES